MFGSNEGSWNINCDSDKRFNANGRASGSWDANEKMDEFILNKAMELKIEPPEDIEISFFKD